MISIRESVSELERSHQLRKTALGSYVSALKGAARFAVDLEPAITDPFRTSVERLAHEVERGEELVIAESAPRFLTVLRKYRDDAAGYIGNLRTELASSLNFLEGMVKGLAENDGEQGAKIRNSLSSVRDISKLPECARIRPVLLSAVSTIENGLEEIRRKQQLMVAEFQAEIKLLHQRIDGMERAASADGLSSCAGREELEKLIGEGGAGNGSLLLLKTSGLRAAEQHYGQQIASELAGAFVKRLKICLDSPAIVGRWAEEAFVATLHTRGADAIPAARRIAESLSGVYPAVHNEKNIRLTLHVSVAVVQTEPSETRERTLDRVREFFAAQQNAT